MPKTPEYPTPVYEQLSRALIDTNADPSRVESVIKSLMAFTNLLKPYYTCYPEIPLLGAGFKRTDAPQVYCRSFGPPRESGAVAKILTDKFQHRIATPYRGVAEFNLQFLPMLSANPFPFSVRLEQVSKFNNERFLGYVPNRI